MNENEKPTQKQIEYARKLGIENPESYTKQQLSSKIDEVKSNINDIVFRKQKKQINDKFKTDESKIYVNDIRIRNNTSSKIKDILSDYIRVTNRIIILQNYIGTLASMIQGIDRIDLYDKIDVKFEELLSCYDEQSKYYSELLSYYFDDNYRDIINHVLSISRQDESIFHNSEDDSLIGGIEDDEIEDWNC